MKKWSKKLICGVLTTAMVLMMAACGDGREDGDQTDSSGSVSSGTESVAYIMWKLPSRIMVRYLWN